MAADIQPRAENPEALIAAAFAAVAAGPMQGLPFNNPALRVEAVGFGRWHGHWLGVLIAPWTMSLLLLPGDGPGFRRLQGTDSQVWQFPSGAFEFHGGHHDNLGPYQSCPLFSPPAEFASQEAARSVAETVLATLLAADGLAEPPPSVSRRSFLLGPFGTGRE